MSRRLALGAGLSLGATLGVAANADAAEFVVSSTGDGPSGGTLRQAIGSVENNNNAPTVDRILFQSGLTGTITLGSDLPVITEPVEIVGPGADEITISGNDARRILHLNASDPVTISGLSLVDGHATGYGGAIYAETSVTLVGVRMAGNDASEGGGITEKGGDLTIRNSTISGNSAGSGGGGIEAIQGTLTVQRSTISGNTAGYGGGLLLNETEPTISGSTIAGNKATAVVLADGGGILLGGGSPETVTLTNTIVADNTAADAGPDLSSGLGDQFTLGFSLVEDLGGVGIGQTGPNIFGQDPHLGPLAANGGPTPTQALAANSPALDTGSDTGADQRGLARPADFLDLANAAGGNGADIGAFELQPGRCKGKAATVPTTTGTPGKDVIVGTAGADAIAGKGGADLICAGGGKDKVSGGAGNDVLLGEAGNDILRGQRGRDRLVGGPGRDRLVGGPRKDKLIGGPGKDVARQ